MPYDHSPDRDIAPTEMPYEYSPTEMSYDYSPDRNAV